MSSTSTISNSIYINSLFLVPFPDKVEGVPTYNYIHESHLKLKTNSGSVHSDIGGIVNGILGLFMRPDLYLIMDESEFNHPQHPGYFRMIPD